MKLYLVQHGEAMPESENPARPLTERGRQQVSRMSVVLARAGIKVPRVIHSGKPRSRDSAAILAGALANGPIVEEASVGLAPNDDPNGTLSFLAGETVDVMLVGHLPSIGRLAGLLLSGQANAMPLAFQPGAVACLEGASLDPMEASGQWTLAWFLRPDTLGF
ncbi:MAG: phosphohistidine phosphatase SixA [Rhodospirillales bacterium]